jgi:Co/Zn/Cd efflux system component
MSGCGCDVKFDGASVPYRRVLIAVIAINAVMFVVELVAGSAAGSQALLADALDFFADAATYSISLLVIGMPLIWRSRAALLKGFALAGMGVWVLGSTLYQVMVAGVPQAAIMGAVGLLALGANLTSVLLLLKFRDGDANVRSVWLCSRNDAIGNVAVVIAASGVWATKSAAPDLIVAGIMASLFLWSAASIFRQALAEIRGSHHMPETAFSGIGEK